MSGKVEDVKLPEIKISHFIACKNHDEKVTTIHTCRIYNDVFTKKRESNQQQVQKNKGIKRILLVDDEYDVNLVIKLVLEENGFQVDSFTDASEALENFRTGLYDPPGPLLSASAGASANIGAQGLDLSATGGAAPSAALKAGGLGLSAGGGTVRLALPGGFGCWPCPELCPCPEVGGGSGVTR